MEISNKFLVIVLIIAIVVSLGGTFLNVERVNQLSKFMGLSGYDVYSYVNVTLSNLTAINVTDTSCNFGTGYINATKTTALLESNGTSINWSAGAITPGSIVVRNDGNRNVSLTLIAGKNITGFYGTGCNTSSPACEYKFWSTENKTDTCSGGTLTAYPGFVLNGSNESVCTVMRYEDDKDAINILCHLLLSQDILTGSKSDVWTFYGTQI